ncbi:MAG: ATP cone domain-containing protein, partial [Bacteroidota bacterium]|nr:ATP cone domain-containing protein [Bacteroidota bacterium]
MKIEYITKRDFTTKPFNLEKITAAILKAMTAVGNGNEQNAQDVALSVYQKLLDRKKEHAQYIPTIEEVQDIVERQLMESKFPEVAKAYILYRNKRTQDRQANLF